MMLAELEVYHSRPVAPTRRVALGRMTLPVDPPPGFGGILLGGVVARNIGSVDPDLVPDLVKLTHQLENGLRVAQPRLRHRFQRDKVGLQRSRHRLIGNGDDLSFDFADVHGDPAQQVLGAVYAAGQMPMRIRPAVMGTLRRGIGWHGAIDATLVNALAGFNKGANWSAHALSHPVEWALKVLGLDRPAYVNGGSGGSIVSGTNGTSVGGNGHLPSRSVRTAHRVNGVHPAGSGANGSRLTGPGPSRPEIQRAYRRLLIAAHPDHGGEVDNAAQRIADLTEARRILLG